jgi:hypothetical protein
MSFALLAIVGGALAFKAKFTDFPICTTSLNSYVAANPAKTSCTIFDHWITTNVQKPVSYYTTTADDDLDCFVGATPLPCNASTFLVHE